VRRSKRREERDLSLNKLPEAARSVPECTKQSLELSSTQQTCSKKLAAPPLFSSHLFRLPVLHCCFLTLQDDDEQPARVVLPPGQSALVRLPFSLPISRSPTPPTSLSPPASNARGLEQYERSGPDPKLEFRKQGQGVDLLTGQVSRVGSFSFPLPTTSSSYLFPHTEHSYRWYSRPPFLPNSLSRS
jgi:hypothetical protein